jgi:hypothetical protein
MAMDVRVIMVFLEINIHRLYKGSGSKRVRSSGIVMMKI